MGLMAQGVLGTAGLIYEYLISQVHEKERKNLAVS